MSNYKQYTTIYNDRIKEVLLEGFTLGEEFINLLGKEAVISGSLLWYVLTSSTDQERNWKPADLDIFYCGKSGDTIKSYLEKHKFNLVSKLTSKDENNTFGVFASRIPYNGLEVENWIKNSYFGPIKIQLITGDCVNSLASQLIINKFDFPALENIFDGKQLYIHNPIDVISRKTVLNWAFYILTPEDYGYNVLQERIKKYTSRGLEIIFPTEDVIEKQYIKIEYPWHG